MCDLTLLTVAAAYPSIVWESVVDSCGTHLAVSKMTAMKSNAGHYLGRYCTEIEDGKPTFLEPYSRESGYYPDKETLLKAHAAEMLPVRDCVENNTLYDSGILTHPGK